MVAVPAADVVDELVFCGHRWRFRLELTEEQERLDIPGRLSSVGEVNRSEEHTSELQSPDAISYAVFCLKKKNFFNDTATTEIYTWIYTLSLHDALPIC